MIPRLLHHPLFTLIFAPLLLAGSGNEDGLKKIEVAKKRAVVFADNFETGQTTAWIPDATNQPNCNCYFSGDCVSGTYCNWGPAGPFTEDICNWRQPKPNSVPGAGCDEDAPAAGPICDGICTPLQLGSLFGHEDPDLVVQGFELWSEAMLRPALNGGGPVDPDLAAEAMALPFKAEHAAVLLGRHTADILILAGGVVFYHYFCHFENNDPDPGFWVDLSDDPCRYEACSRSIDAVIAELYSPGSGMGLIDGIRRTCPNWHNIFDFSCGTGPAALECVKNRIRGYGEFLTVPKVD
jgi:hypothetical protein